MDIQLTKESDFLLCSLYKKYLQNRSNGMGKSIAKNMGSSEDIQKDVFPNWSLEDVDETCRELSRTEMLDCLYADDSIYLSSLTDNAIIYMEKRFENNVNKVVDFISKLKSLIPFI